MRGVPAFPIVVLRRVPDAQPIAPDWPHWVWRAKQGQVVGEPVTAEVKLWVPR